jgi:hypothetical protein
MNASTCSGLCPAGFFSRADATRCDGCTAAEGSGCGVGAVLAAGTVCAAGQYGIGGSTPCQPCTAGFVCSGGGTTLTTMVPCPYGYHCPAGTSNGASNPCPANYFCGVGTANATAVSCTLEAPLSAWFDADGDGDADALASTVQGGLLLLRDSSSSVSGDCNGAVVRGMPALDMASMQSLSFADVDGDGDDDVLGVTASSTVVLLLNNGSGFFVNATVRSGLLVAVARAVDVTVGDIDGDGDVDVFICASALSSALLLNNGSGVFADVTAAQLRPGVPDTPVASVMLDADADGRLDLFVALSTGNRLYINDGNGTLVDSGSSRGVASYAGGGVVRGATAADVDGDGDVDVLVFGSGSKQLYVNNGTGWFVDAGAASGVSSAVNAMSASFADADNDGDVDLLMGVWRSSALRMPNNGSGGFNATAAAIGSSVSAQPVFVDVDGDGDVDVPAVGFVNSVVPARAVAVGVATVRVLSRAGHRVCHGATVLVRRSSDGALAASRIVSAGAPYDLHVVVPPSTSPSHDVDVLFPSGRRHSKATQAVLSAVQLSTVSSRSVPLLLVRDTPALVSVRLSPSSGVYGPGSVLTAVVRALGDERGLSAAAACTINGVNVSLVVADWGNGTYSFAYTVQPRHGSAAAVAVSLQLVDPRWAVSSDAVSRTFDGVAVDTALPLVSFNATSKCSPDNDTVTGSANQTLCVSCGSLAAEPFGCVIWVQTNASPPAQPFVASSTNNSVALTVGPFVTGDHPVVVAWARDAAGNVGPSAVLTWEVDLTSPVTEWTPYNPPSHTNQTSMLFSFGCSLTSCSFDYSFASGPRVRIGGGGNSTAGGAAAAVVRVDTVLRELPARFVTVAGVAVNLSLIDRGAATPVNASSGRTTVEVKLDAGAWTDVQAYGSAFDIATQRLSLSGLSDGEHTLQARGRVLEDSDLSPWTHVWTVDRRPPNVSFWLAPPLTSTTPACSADFVLVANEEAAAFEVQWRALNTSTDDGSVNGSAWRATDSVDLTLSGLTAAVPYVLHARATDRAGNVGAVSSWRWSSGGCPSSESLAVALAVESYALAVDARAVMWSAPSLDSRLPDEVQYRVNDGPWLRTRDRPIRLRGLSATTHYRVDVRPAVPCGCEAVIAEQPASSVSWFTYEGGPGRVGIVSAPTPSSNSLYGDFELNSTARDSWFEYSLDGGSFAGCSSRLRVGPLVTGSHNVTVRSVDANGSYVAAAQRTHAWTVVSLSSSSLSLPDLSDGSHSLTVWAVAGAAEERSPRTVRWLVDTIAPGVSASLVTPPVTNAATAVVRASCVAEDAPDLCTYCVSLSGGGGASNRSCASSGTLVIPLAGDRLYEAWVSAVDAAGNEGAPQRLVWTRDTVPPRTFAAVNTAMTATVPAMSLSANATNATRLVFSVASSEVGSSYSLFLDGVAVDVGVTSGPTVVVNATTDGVHTVVVAAVDVAGNVDPTPFVGRFVVDTVSPSTSVVTQPAPVSNVSTAVVSWRASGELAGMLSRFVLSSTPALDVLPSFVIPDDGGMALTASLTLAGMRSGAYTVMARAVDTVGHVDAVGASFSFVVDLDAPSSRLVHSLTPFVNRSRVAVGVNASDALSSVAAFVRVDGDAWQSVPSGAGATVTLALADGAHRIECRSVDAAGNAQPPPYDGVDVTVDTTPPDISVAVGAVPTFNALSVVAVSVSVSDATATTVRGVLDGAVDKAVSRVGSGIVSVDVATDGNHTLAVSGVDAAGNAGAASVSWFTDRVAPVTVASLSHSSTFVGDSTASVRIECVNEAFPQLCVACWQYAAVDGAGAMVTSMGRCELTSTLSFVYTVDGVATLDVFSVDAAGNVGGNASSVTWTWDRTPPDTAVSVDGGVWLASMDAWAVSSASPVLTVSVSEAAASFVSVTVDGVLLTASVVASKVTLSALTDGVHAVAVAGVDLAGNEDSAPTLLNVLVDTTAPTTEMTSAPAALVNASSVDFLLSAGNEWSGSVLGFQLLTSPSVADVPPLLNVSDDGVSAALVLSSLRSGAYVVTARAVDVFGHVDPVGVQSSFVVDLEPPTTRLLYSAPHVVNDSTVVIGVSGSDALSAVSAYLRVDGGAWQSVPSGAGATVSLTLADGAYRIECRGVDEAGNAQPPPYDAVDVTVDTTPPYVSVAAGAVPVFNALSVVSVTVTVFDATTTIVRGVLDGSVDTGVSRVGGGVVSVVVVADGNHTLVLSCEDAAGNAGGATLSWFTDRVSPVTTAALAGTSRFVRDVSASVSVACVNEAFPQLCVACWHYSVASASGSVASLGGCESTRSLLFAYTSDGVATLDVFSVDAAGNVGGNASRVTWAWDRTPPDTAVSVDGGVWLPSLSVWAINSSSVAVVLSSAETVARFDIVLDGGTMPSLVNSSMLLLRGEAAGRHTLVVTAVDVAGNADATPANVTVVVDLTAPPPPRFQLLRERGCFELPRSPVTVCNASDSIAFDAACSEASSRDASPCAVEWRLDAVSVSSGGGSSDSCVGGSGSGAVQGGAWTQLADSVLQPKPPRDGQYRVWWRASDAAGNVGAASSMLLWLDTTPPPKEPTFVATPGSATFSLTARFEVVAVGDTSPGRLSFVYELTRGAVVEPLAVAPLPEPTNEDVVQLLVGGLIADESYSLKVWTQDQAGHRSAKAALHTWTVLSEAPTVRFATRPSTVSALIQPVFVFSAVWAEGSSRQGDVPDASFLVSLVGVNSPHSPCDERGAAPNCLSWCNGTRCEYSPRLDTPQPYTLQVQAVLGGRAGDVVSVLWEYRRCSSDEYAELTNGDAVTCHPCPIGGDCAPANPLDIVQLKDVVSQAEWWASTESDGKLFYRCPIPLACLPGAKSATGSSNATRRTECAEGYAGVLCSTCAADFFPQYGTCSKCPAKASPASMLASVTLPMCIVVLFGIMFFVRSLAPRGMMKVGVSMVQIVAAANSAYSIPWPPSFASLQNAMKLFLIDVISLSKADCASPVLYYQTLLITLLGFKAIIIAAIAASYALQRLRERRARTGRWCCLCGVAVARRASRILSPRAVEFSLGWTPKLHSSARASSVTDGSGGGGVGGSGSGGISGGTAVRRVSARAGTLQRQKGVISLSVGQRLKNVQWSSLFRALFMILFIAYPSVSQKILRIFWCRLVEGRYYLAADMRLQCYTREWYGYAIYAFIMGVVYVAGLPLSIAVILVRRRRVLFGAGSAETRRVYGFLYEAYGPVAWWWEVEELLRKLFLTALVVVLDPGSPLQVTLAVLVSGWAHVLHAVYKPWRLSPVPTENRTYMVQHASLFVTSFVFLMGLLFKVEGVSSKSRTYESLAAVMLLLCLVFVIWWCYEMFSQVAKKLCARVRSRRNSKAPPSATSGVEAVVGVGGVGVQRAEHTGGDAIEADVERAPLTATAGGGRREDAGVGGGDGAAVAARLAGDGAGVAQSSDASDSSGDAKVTAGQRSALFTAGAIAVFPGLPSTVAPAEAAEDSAFRSHGGAASVAVTNPMHVRRNRGSVTAPAAAPPMSGSGAADDDGEVSALSVYFQPRRAGGGAGVAATDGRSRAARVSALKGVATG